MPAIDLNADLGEHPGSEGEARDLAMLACVSSANIACGFHAGGGGTMRRVAAAAVSASVRVGAHVAYADREHFGRRDIEISPALLRSQVLEQLRALADCAPLVYLKPHGALYHRVMHDPLQARAVLDAIADFGTALPVLGQAGSVFFELAAAQGLVTIAEGFADRRYEADGRLRDRKLPGAVLDDAAEVRAQALELIAAGRVQSLCLHGDTQGAVALARELRDGLQAAGVTIRPFA